MPPPDRWGDYTPLGAVIEGTRILCCKVPLKHSLVRTLPEEERFTPEILINKVWEMGCGLGLIVDLTFTKKYYSSDEFTGKGVLYHKIFTKGHDVPSNTVYGRFANILSTYVEQNKNNTSVIGVHCTHGVNRTGYLVCRYLIERHNMSPEDAIGAFNKARGHDLERDNYLHDLRTRKPGVITEYDPSAVDEDEEEAPYVRKKFPKSRREVENSYSKLLDMHRPETFSEWFRQRERDKMMRNERRSTEDMSEDWMQRSREEQNMGSFSGGFRGGYRGGKFGGQRGRDLREDEDGGYYMGGHPERGHGYGTRDGYQSTRGRKKGNNGDNGWYNTQRDDSISNDDSYDSRGSFIQNQGYRYNKNDNYDAEQEDSGEVRQRYRDGYGQRGYGDDQSYGYGDDQSYGYGDDQSYGNGDDQSYGYGDDQSYGYGDDQSYGYGEGYQQDYRSPMRYADWSGDYSEQYARSGWQSMGQGRGGQRPSRRGRAGRW